MWLEAPPHVKLIDFGITKSLNEQDNVLSTTTGSTPGTKPYMSPSAFQGRLDVRSDIYALIVSMLETSIGYVPENLAFTAPVPVGELRQKGYSEPFIGFIDKGLQKDPLNGFQTAVAALDQAKLLPSARAKTGLTTMKKQLASVLQGQEVVVEKLDENKRKLEENQDMLREQGAVVTAMAGRFANMEGSIDALTRLNRAGLRLVEELVRDEICCPRLIWIMPKPKVQTVTTNKPTILHCSSSSSSSSHPRRRASNGWAPLLSRAPGSTTRCLYASSAPTDCMWCPVAPRAAATRCR
jgi:serine/threonine protein kinase